MIGSRAAVGSEQCSMAALIPEACRRERHYLFNPSSRNHHAYGRPASPGRNTKSVGWSSSAIERVTSQFVFYPSCWRCASTLAGRRSWVIGHCRLAVHIRPRVSARVAQLQSDSAIQIAPCPLFHSALAFYSLHFEGGPNSQVIAPNERGGCLPRESRRMKVR